tara:strand:- start:287 stop:1282 length:996 start_codon:yes stop_codon:yes gene_type:complete
MSIKSELGQFYTTNSDYILQGMDIPRGVRLIEPFVGRGDLINWSSRTDWEKFDLDPKDSSTTRQDTLMNPPIYKDKYIVTNPPYLASNKTNEQQVFRKWGQSDLYKCFVKSFIDGDASGGIMIIPLNFLCDRDTKLREEFFTKYHIDKINIFEERVFDDTDYTVCSIQFDRGPQQGPFPATIYPSKSTIDIDLSSATGWRIAGHLFEKAESEYSLKRLIIDKPHNEFITGLKLRAIDGGSMDNRIKLLANQEPFYGKISDRTNATITTNIKIKDEQFIADKFNSTIEDLRSKYHSLFLTNYRMSSKHYARKRISYTLAFNILTSILNNKDK